MEKIKDFGMRIAREFHPERVILFGSFASDQANEDSDVDLLVIMDYEGKPWRTAACIRQTLRPDFPMDLLVRTPEQVHQRIQMGDSFFKDITKRGTILYETTDMRMD